MTEAASGKSSRFVFDTNVLVSALLFSDSVPGRAFFTALAQGVVLVSEGTAQELADVLSRPKFDRYVTAGERDRFLSALLMRAELVEVQSEVRACRDPRGDKVLSLALAGSASAIVTGDEDLLGLHPFQGIRILRPQAFLSERETS